MRARIRFGRRQVRPHERPDVGGRAPALEALHARADGPPSRAARARRRGRHRRPRRRHGAAGRRQPASSCSPTSMRRCSTVGRDRLLDRGLLRQRARMRWPTPSACPSRTSTSIASRIGFGLRNVTDKPAALASMRRVLKPGGRLLVLEFSSPRRAGPEARLRPVLVQRAAVARRAHREGRRTAIATWPSRSARFPDQDTLLGMMREAGFEDCRYHNLTGGIVALHKGLRY